MIVAAILVVDDRRINRELLTSLLGYAGHETFEASDGREGLEVARRIKPALVITDILMPTMDGVEFARSLRRDPATRHVPIIFHTATYRINEAQALGASCGVSTIVSKPCDPRELLDTVHRELGLEEPDVMSEPALWKGRQHSLAVDRLCNSCVAEIAEVKQELRATLLRGNVYVPDVESWRAHEIEQIAARTDASLTRARALSLRLATLIELNLELAAHRDSASMVEIFCRAARDILNGRLAAVCMLDDTGHILEFVAWGMPPQQVERVRRALVPTAGVFGEVMSGDAPDRRSNLERHDASLGLPACHPVIENLLTVPIKSSARTCGWFYVADRLGADGFSEEDQELAETLAALLGREYENLLLCDKLQRHSDILQVEVDERQSALSELRESENRFHQLAENVREVFFLIEAESGKFLYLSPQFEEIWDRSRESLYIEPLSWLASVHPADYAAVLRELAKARRSGLFQLKYRIQTASRQRWVRARSFPVHFDGRLSRIAGTVEDITENELQARSIERLSRIQAVHSEINSAIVRIHEQNVLLEETCRVAVANGGFKIAWIGIIDPSSDCMQFVACSGANAASADMLSHILVDEYRAKRGLCIDGLESETHVVHNDIRTDPVSDQVLRVALEQGYPSAAAIPLRLDRRTLGVFVLFAPEANYFNSQELQLLHELARDISFALEYISREKQLNYIAYYDTLTHLPNVDLFYEHLTRSIERSSASKVALFLVDIDQFTRLNNSLGRHIGDELLGRIGERLRAVFDRHGDVARAGSDTFAIAVPALREGREAGAILRERILAVLNRPFLIAGRELRISARAGVALYPDDGGDAETLFKNAEAALKEAKSSGGRHFFYSHSLNERIAEDLELQQELLVAIEREQLDVWYQPEIDVRTERIVGLEALLRWQHPQQGLILPARFIPALEASELIIDVGRWVLERALSDYRSWHARGLELSHVAVNVSPVQLRYSDFDEMILSALDRYGLDGSMLALELTETAIMDNMESSAELLRRIADAGVMIALDDFGTGYSSLRYLAKLPLHAMKIDRGFVDGVATNTDDMMIIAMIMRLGHALGLRVIAEGVESAEQARVLKGMNCDVMQGFLFGPPRSADEIASLLAGQ